MKEDAGIYTVTGSIMEQIKSANFEMGVRYALEYLESVYGEGIQKTDIWSEYMSGDKN